MRFLFIVNVQIVEYTKGVKDLEIFEYDYNLMQKDGVFIGEGGSLIEESKFWL